MYRNDLVYGNQEQTLKAAKVVTLLILQTHSRNVFSLSVHEH